MRPENGTERLVDELRALSACEAPVHLNSIASKLGVSAIRYLDIPEEGRLIRRSSGRVEIEIRADRRSPRKRFTLAHELAHLWLDHGSRREDFVRGSSPDARRRSEERLCDAIAGALLMPTWAVAKAQEGGRCDDLDGLRKLATDFRCSLSATATRVMEVTGSSLMVAEIAFTGERRPSSVSPLSRRPKGIYGPIDCLDDPRAVRQGRWTAVRVKAGDRLYWVEVQSSVNGNRGVMLMRGFEPRLPGTSHRAVRDALRHEARQPVRPESRTQAAAPSEAAASRPRPIPRLTS